MTSQGESQAVNRPPFFTGSNYTYWKVKMRAFLQSIDERVWEQVVNGLSPLAENTTQIPNTDTSKTLNSKGLNAIFSAICDDVFPHIANCTDVKTAWDILQNIYEGNKQEQDVKLIRLTSEWESLVMHEDKCFDDFYAKLSQNINSSYALGKVYEDSVIVSKILRSLPLRFDIKKESIIESKDINKMSRAEIVGKMRIFEMGMRYEKPTKAKKVAHFVTKNHSAGKSNDQNNYKNVLTSMNDLVGTLKELITQEDLLDEEKESQHSRSNNQTVSLMASINEDTSKTKDDIEKLSANIIYLTKELEDKKAEIEKLKLEAKQALEEKKQSQGKITKLETTVRILTQRNDNLESAAEKTKSINTQKRYGVGYVPAKGSLSKRKSQHGDRKPDQSGKKPTHFKFTTNRCAECGEIGHYQKECKNWAKHTKVPWSHSHEYTNLMNNLLHLSREI